MRNQLPRCYKNLGLPWWLSSKELPPVQKPTEDMGLVPGLGSSPRGGHGNPLQYFCLENPMDKGACWATVHRVTNNWTQLKRLIMHIQPLTLCVLMAVMREGR